MKEIKYTKGIHKGKVYTKEDQFADSAIAAGIAEEVKAGKQGNVEQKQDKQPIETKELKQVVETKSKPGRPAKQ